MVTMVDTPTLAAPLERVCIERDFAPWPESGESAPLVARSRAGVPADIATGGSRRVSQGTVPTARPMAANSAVAARRLANRGVRTRALIGTGDALVPAPRGPQRPCGSVVGPAAR